MLFQKIQQLVHRKIRAKKLGIKFNRVASFQLPQQLIVQGKRHQVNVPSEKGMNGEFIEVLLDDCYGVEQLSESQMKIIDVGANVGLFPIAARNRFPQAVIHAYEPNPYLENSLKHQSKIANFTYFMEAVGDRDGKVVLDIREVSGKTRSTVKLFRIKTGIIINHKSQKSQKYASQESSKCRASQKASTSIKTRRKWRN